MTQSAGHILRPGEFTRFIGFMLHSPIRTLLLAALVTQAAAVLPTQPDLAEATRQVIHHANEFRAAHGVGATRPAATLTQAAQAFANHMARTDRYSHEADGRSPVQRANAHGYDHCLVSENIAFVQSSAGFGTRELAERLVRGWKESPGHRENMLDAAATETGVAIAQSARSKRYYAVQMFGRPRDQAIEFSIVNRSPSVVRYELGGRSYELRPQVTRTHQQCRITQLSVRLPGRAEPATAEPGNGASYVIEREGTQGYRLSKG
jgi:uncharacterized protein YkwD